MTFFLVHSKLNGQEINGQDITKIKYQITTSPMQFVLNEYSLKIERFINNHSIGLKFGYRPSRNKLHEINQGLEYFMQNYWNYLYNAYSIELNSKYYLKKKKNYFIDFSIFYRHWWFDNKYCEYYNEKGYFIKGIRTENQEVYGLKTQLGKTIYFKSGHLIKPLFDIYCGIGVRYKMCKFNLVTSSYNDTEYKNYLSPSIHFGVNFGFGL